MTENRINIPAENPSTGLFWSSISWRLRMRFEFEDWEMEVVGLDMFSPDLRFFGWRFSFWSIIWMFECLSPFLDCN
jgi:hypothetical protein